VKRYLAVFEHGPDRDGELTPAVGAIALVEPRPMAASSKLRDALLIRIAAMGADGPIPPGATLKPGTRVALAFKDLAMRKTGRAPAHGLLCNGYRSVSLHLFF
jgi:hypothetical protein